MKIGFKILLGIILSVVVAYIAGYINGEIPFVEGVSGIIVFLLPLISILLVIGLEYPKDQTSKSLITAAVIFTIILIAGVIFI